MKDFQNRYILYGVLEYDKKEIGHCRCELLTSEVDQDVWRATISAFEGSMVELHHVMREPSNFRFISNDDNESIVIDGRFPSISHSAYNDEILKFKLSTYVKHTQREGLERNKILLTYYIPKVKLYERQEGLHKHYKKGLLTRWIGWRKEFSDKNVSDEWLNEVYSIQSPLGNIEFSPILLFQENSSDEGDSILTVEQMVIECEIISGNKSFAEVRAEVEKEIESSLIMLSFLEGDKIDWYLCRGFERSIDGKSISEFEMFRSVVKRKTSKHFVERIHSNRKKIQEAHVNLTKLFLSKAEDEKQRIQKLLDRFILASRITAIDTKLIYWHSCLDVLIKECGGQGKSFSRRLLDSCRKMETNWLDIYPELTDEFLKEGGDIPINRIRNEMLHEGEYPEHYDEVLKEIPRTKALCERLITKIIGLGYKDTGIGLVERY